MLEPFLPLETLFHRINRFNDKKLLLSANQTSELCAIHTSFKQAKTEIAVVLSRSESYPGMSRPAQLKAQEEREFWEKTEFDKHLDSETGKVFGEHRNEETFCGSTLMLELKSFMKEAFRNAVTHGEKDTQAHLRIAIGTDGVAIIVRSFLKENDGGPDQNSLSELARRINGIFGLQYAHRKGYRYFRRKVAQAFMRPMDSNQYWGVDYAGPTNSRGIGFANMAKTPLYNAWLHMQPDVVKGNHLDVYCVATKEQVTKVLARELPSSFLTNSS